MTFDDWIGNDINYLSSKEARIAREAWEAAMKQVNVADNQTLAALKHEGYVLVPVEPTKKLVVAGLGEIEGVMCLSEMHNAYKAMIQASQEEK